MELTKSSKFGDMKGIVINVHKDMDGYTFSVPPSVRKLVVSKFPQANPVSRLFVGFDTRDDFELHHDRIERHISPVLLGLSSKRELKKFSPIQFVMRPSGKILYTLRERVQA